MNHPPTVFVVDDDESMRRSLDRLLRSAGLRVVTFASAQEYIDHYNPSLPGCLLLDLAMDGLSGLELQDVLREKGGAPSIVFLSGHAALSDGVRAIKEGAVEFLTKPVDEGPLLDAVRQAIEKDRVDRAQREGVAEIRRRLASLTPRETQVLRCVVAGMRNKQIAAQLGTVEKTIKVHRLHVMEKMLASSLAELVQLSMRAGVIDAGVASEGPSPVARRAPGTEEKVAWNGR